MINKNSPFDAFFANCNLELATEISISYSMDIIKFHIDKQLSIKNSQLDYKLKRIEYILNQ